MTKVLINTDLDDSLIQQIREVSEEVEVTTASSEGEALEIMPEVEVVLGPTTPAMFDRGDRLRWVQNLGAGVDGVIFPKFLESDVVLTSAKGIVGIHLADHAMALLLALTRGIATAVRKPSFSQRWPIRAASWELAGRTMGIVGLGGTGQALALRAAGFGMRIIAVDPEDVEAPDSVESCWKMDRFHDLLAESDVVAVCAPLTRETAGMFDAEAFRRMRNHAMLINVTRGRIVDETALMHALEQGQIGGAGLDVVPQEPLPEAHPLWHMPNVVITPHTAGGSPHRIGRTVDLFCDNLARHIAGRPMKSVIDKRKGY